LLGHHKHDKYSDPVCADNPWQVRFLREAEHMFRQWRESKLVGLTAQTFAAFIHTTGALADFSEHLLKKDEFDYILLGRCQSDPIEARFGRYRQLCGANFYVSVRQIVESESKIRVLNLMQQKCDLRLMNYHYEVDIDVPNWMQESLEKIDLFNFEVIDTADLNVIFYVAGYIGRSLARENKCEKCKEVLLERKTHEDVDLDAESITELHQESKRLLDMANRGGLSEPTDATFAIACVTFLCYDYIRNNSQFLQLLKHRTTFVKAVQQRCESEDANFADFKCNATATHRLFSKIVFHMFNCFAKNLLKRLNDASGENVVTSRKIRKLQGESSK
jgi:hypothetical protein